MSPTILLAEPSFDQRTTIADFLTHHLPGVTILRAGSSTQALQHWRSAQLVIMAQRLVPESGLVCIRRIRVEDAQVLILMYTSLNELEDEAMDAGATQFLAKGSLPALLRTICELLWVSGVSATP